MRQISRALAVLAVGGALAVQGASPALAAPCPPDTYPLATNCTIVDPVAVGVSGDETVAGESFTTVAPE